MKRFLVFAGDNYYPGGGWRDFRGSVDTLEEARALVDDGSDWWHVVDTTAPLPPAGLWSEQDSCFAERKRS